MRAVEVSGRFPREGCVDESMILSLVLSSNQVRPYNLRTILSLLPLVQTNSSIWLAKGVKRRFLTQFAYQSIALVTLQRGEKERRIEHRLKLFMILPNNTLTLTAMMAQPAAVERIAAPIALDDALGIPPDGRLGSEV